MIGAIAAGIGARASVGAGARGVLRAGRAAVAGEPPGATARRLSVAKGGEGRLEKLWRWDTGFNLYDRLVQSVGTVSPTFTHVIHVNAVGGPQADIRRIWYLCLSAAFGRYRGNTAELNAITSQNIDAVWDITGKRVSVEIGYNINGMSQYFPGGATTAATGGIHVLQRGPEQLTIGAGWPSFLQTSFQVLSSPMPPEAAPVWNVVAPCPRGFFSLFGFTLSRVPVASMGVSDFYTNIGGGTVNVLREYPVWGNDGTPRAFPYRILVPLLSSSVGFVGMNAAVVNGGKAPVLPDDGRIITTGEKGDPGVQSPRPPIDGSTRMNLLALVAQSLRDPCSLPATPPCTFTPTASSGRYIHNPGANVSDVALSGAIEENAIDGFGLMPSGISDLVPGVGVSLPANNLGPDGYPLYSGYVVDSSLTATILTSPPN